MYAERFGVQVRTRTRVASVAREGAGFAVTTAAGRVLAARSLVAASSGFGRPYQPTLPGTTEFSGRPLHAAAYRRPDSFAGRRVVVVGGGHSAVQIAVELAGSAESPWPSAGRCGCGTSGHWEWTCITGPGGPVWTGSRSAPTVPGRGYVGLPGQTGFASATVRGVGPTPGG